MLAGDNAPGQGARSRQRRLGGVLAYVQIGLNVAIALIYTPFMVNALGQANYGLFAIAGAMASYLIILDMGLADSVVRRLVGFHVKEDAQGEQGFLGSMLSLYGLVALAVLVVSAVLVLLVPSLFGGRLSPGEIEALRTMLVPLGVGAAVVVASNPVNAALIAYERFVFLRVLEMAASLSITSASVVVLLHGGGVVAIVVTSTLGVLCTNVAKWLAVGRGLRLPLTPRRLHRPQVLEMSTYAAPIFVSMLVEQIFWKLDNILIGARLGAAAVAVYAIGVMFNKYFMAFATAISRVMMPDLVRRIDSGSSIESLTERLVEVSRWQAMTLMLVLSGLLLFGQHFIHAWMGPGYELSYWVLTCTLGPYAFELIGNVRNVVLQVQGLYWWRAGIFLAAAVLNIPATLWAMSYWGLVGAAACTGMGIFLAYLGVAWVLSSKVGIPVLSYLAGVWRGIAQALVVAVLLGIGLEYQFPSEGWLALGLKVVIYTLAYLALIWTLGLDDAERRQVRSVILRRVPA